MTIFPHWFIKLDKFMGSIATVYDNYVRNQKIIVIQIILLWIETATNEF